MLIIGELLKQAEGYISEVRSSAFQHCLSNIVHYLDLQGLHPRVIADGFELAKKKAMEVLDSMKIEHAPTDRIALTNVARTALTTKIHPRLADQLTEICVDAVLAIQQEGIPLDLFMVEIMQMQHRSEEETSLVKGLVMDHGPRHPDMKRMSKNAYILTCNVSLEYEKT